LPEAIIETPPDIDTPVPTVETEWQKMVPPIDPSTVKAPPEKRPQPPRLPAIPQTPPETEIPPPVSPPAPVPHLGEILTDSRRREYEADYSRFLAEARAAMSRTSGRRLNATQLETVGRIRIFLQQAEKSHSSDLATALQLARRAELLGQDLLKSLR
jgi:hypothetical protein